MEQEPKEEQMSDPMVGNLDLYEGIDPKMQIYDLRVIVEHYKQEVSDWGSKYRKLEEENKDLKFHYDILKRDYDYDKANWKKWYEDKLLEKHAEEISFAVATASEEWEEEKEKLQSENSRLLGKVKELEELNKTLNLRSL